MNQTVKLIAKYYESQAAIVVIEPVLQLPLLELVQFIFEIGNHL